MLKGINVQPNIRETLAYSTTYVQRMTAYCIGFRVRSFDITLGVYLFSTEARGTSFGNDLNRDRLTVQYNPFD